MCVLRTQVNETASVRKRADATFCNLRSLRATTTTTTAAYCRPERVATPCFAARRPPRNAAVALCSPFHHHHHHVIASCLSARPPFIPRGASSRADAQPARGDAPRRRRGGEDQGPESRGAGARALRLSAAASGRRGLRPPRAFFVQFSYKSAASPPTAAVVTRAWARGPEGEEETSMPKCAARIQTLRAARS